MPEAPSHAAQESPPPEALEAAAAEGPAAPGPDLAPEALLAMAEYYAIEGRFQTQSAAVRQAAQAALRTWMRRQGLRIDGHYPRAAWTSYYDQMLACTGH